MKTKTGHHHIRTQGSLIEVVMGEGIDTQKLRQEVIAGSGGGAMDMLVDMSPATVRVGAEIGPFFRGLPFRRIALFGTPTRSARLAVKENLDDLAQPERIKLFHRQEDARTWLQTKPEVVVYER